MKSRSVIVAPFACLLFLQLHAALPRGLAQDHSLNTGEGSVKRQNAPCTPITFEDDGAGKVVVGGADEKESTEELTPFWAQEMIGSDLIEPEFVGMQLKTCRFALLDSGLLPSFFTGKTAPAARLEYLRTPDRDRLDLVTNRQLHGTAVANLIGGRKPYGLANRAELAGFYGVVSAPWSFREAVDQMLETKPDIINVSYKAPLSGPALSDFNRLLDNSLVVQSSGNQYPFYRVASNSSSNSIMVGSLAPSGLVTRYSTQSEQVTILAPSDDWIQSVDGRSGIASRVTFGGTSGATPLVTGALCNVKSILGELTASEAKILLEKSAIPTLNARQKPRLNGAGTLNAYKLAKIAVRLKTLGWPNKRAELIASGSLYDFQKEAKDLFPEGTTLDSGCESGLFSRLRKAFLLDPTSERAALLAAVYTKHGYPKNALFYENFTEAGVASYVKKGLEASKPADEVIRALGMLNRATAVPLVAELWARSKVPTPAAITAAAEIGVEGLPFLAQGAANPDVNTRVLVANDLMLTGDYAFGLFEKLGNDPEPSVVRKVAQSIRSLPTGQNTLLKLFQNSTHSILRQAVARVAWRLGPDAPVTLVKLAEDPDEEVRATLVYSLYALEGETSDLVEKLRRDRSSRVRSSLVAQSAQLGRVGVEIFRDALESADPTTRESALRVAEQFGPSIIPRLSAFLERKDLSDEEKQTVTTTLEMLRRPR